MTDLNYDQKAQEIAEAAAQAMFERDAASKGLGMQIEKMGPGYAKLKMTVSPDMLNGHQTCHGGFIFTLADSAFAFSCNSYNFNTVAAGCSIEFLAPGKEGDVLTAEAIEQARGRKTGVYDVTVSNQDGTHIALFRGKSHQIKGEILEGFIQDPSI